MRYQRFALDSFKDIGLIFEHRSFWLALNYFELHGCHYFKLFVLYFVYFSEAALSEFFNELVLEGKKRILGDLLLKVNHVLGCID